ELAPPQELLDRYRTDRDWAAYEPDFEDLVLRAPAAKRTLSELVERSRNKVLALLCSEPTPERCHRRLVVERIRQIEPGLQVIHLT
ncbi:MAG: DUF488 family protein, N3 subclade, partial [Gaiellaceae bacterium]